MSKELMLKMEAKINQLRAELDKYRWIPVSEGLPERTKEDWRPKFLIYNADGAAVQEWRHYDFGWDFDGFTGRPTHYMPVPESPEPVLESEAKE